MSLTLYNSLDDSAQPTITRFKKQCIKVAYFIFARDTKVSVVNSLQLTYDSIKGIVKKFAYFD